MSAPSPAPATNAPASTGFLSGLFGAKKTNEAKPANAAAPVAPAVGGRRRASRKDRKNRSRKDRSRSRKDRKDRSRKDRSRSRKNRNRK